MVRTVIVDYGLCNMDSIARAVSLCGGQPFVTQKPTLLAEAERIVLPGVGSFAEAARALREFGLEAALQEHVRERRVPLLGICLGMQLLASEGWEGGHTNGLDLIPGEIRRLEPSGDDRRIPHVGWNEVMPKSDLLLFRDVRPNLDFYFVHSYHFVCRRSEDSVAVTPYCGGFTSVVNHEHIWGVQFHPEKSQDRGFHVLRNFLSGKNHAN